MSRYDFALQWLDFLGVKIYNKGQQILEYTGDPDYEIAPMDTKIKYGEDLFLEEEEEPEYTIMSYPDMLTLGFVVKSESNPDYFWKKAQRCYYIIRRKRRDTLGITYENYRKISSLHGVEIQQDAANRRFRLTGENVLSDVRIREDSCMGPWIQYTENRPVIDTKKRRKNISKEESRQRLKNKMFGRRNNIGLEYQEIKEVPVLISDEKYIVCIPKLDIAQRLIIVGESGMGKSLSVNGIAHRIFYQWEERMGWLIDPLNQLHDLSLPQDYMEFNKLNALINDNPRPIPAIQQYLACRHPLKIKHKNISLTLTLNFHEFLRKMQFFGHGIKDWDLGATRRYLTDSINDIKNMTDIKELKKIMFEKIPNAGKDKGMQAMIYKWQNTFGTIFKENFTSNLYKDNLTATDELEVVYPDGKVMKGHPFIMAMEAGVIPVLNISAARRQAWVRNYLADLMQKIVRHQIGKDDKDKKRMWIVADELNEIYEVGKKKDNAYSAFEELFRQGRINKIGFIGNTQSLDKLNPEMYDNATHICCVYMKSNKDRKKVGVTFDLPKETYTKIEQLKPLEMMVFSKYPFVIYDRWGRRKVVTDRKWFKGKILPPINYHKSPE